MPARERRFNVPVPLSFKNWIDRQVDAGGFGTPAEYIRHLLRHAQAATTVDEIDRPGLRISAARGDSIALYLGRSLKRATLIETDGTIADMKRKFEANQIDAFGANRQRLTALTNEMPAYRLLPDNILDVPQTIVVPKGRTAALATVNAFIDDVRQSGFLKAAIEKSGVIGIDVAPAGYGYGKVE